MSYYFDQSGLFIKEVTKQDRAKPNLFNFAKQSCL